MLCQSEKSHYEMLHFANVLSLLPLEVDGVIYFRATLPRRRESQRRVHYDWSGFYAARAAVHLRSRGSLGHIRKRFEPEPTPETRRTRCGSFIARRGRSRECDRVARAKDWSQGRS